VIEVHSHLSSTFDMKDSIFFEEADSPRQRRLLMLVLTMLKCGGRVEVGSIEAIQKKQRRVFQV
jgi:hypothetical protein